MIWRLERSSSFPGAKVTNEMPFPDHNCPAICIVFPISKRSISWSVIVFIGNWAVCFVKLVCNNTVRDFSNGFFVLRHKVTFSNNLNVIRPTMTIEQVLCYKLDHVS